MNKVIIVCDSDTGGIFDYSKLVYKKLAKFKNVEFLYHKKEGRFGYYKKLLSKVITANSTTIIDLQCLIWPITILLILVKKIRGFKLIFEAHDEPFSRKLKYRPFFVRNFIMKSIDMVVAHSRFCESRCRKIRGLPKIVYIPFGPLLESVKTIKDKKAKKLLGLENNFVGLFFGIIQPNKGLDILIKAVPLVISKINNFKLLIVGPSKENFEKYNKMIEKLKIEAYVKKIIKYIPVEKSCVYFSASDIVILPYREITQSAVPFVAYMYKKPVIASDVGGMKEIVYNKRTGVIFESENIIDLSSKIIYCFRNQKKCKKMGRNGFDLITKGEYSWKNITKKYLELINEFEKYCSKSEVARW